MRDGNRFEISDINTISSPLLTKYTEIKPIKSIYDPNNTLPYRKVWKISKRQIQVEPTVSGKMPIN